MSGPITNWERLVLESGSDLSPAKLNEALDKRLGFVTSNLVLVATLATGFGLFSDIAGPLREQQSMLRLILAALLASVVVSLIGNAPNWWKEVDANDLDSIDKYFRARYSWRAWAARIAIGLFTVAMFLTGLTVWNVVNEQSVPAPQVNLRYAAGKEPTAAAVVAAAALPPRSGVRTVLVGCPATTEPGCPADGDVLAIDSSSADSSGKVEIELSSTPVPTDVTRLALRVQIGDLVYGQVVDIR